MISPQPSPRCGEGIRPHPNSLRGTERELDLTPTLSKGEGAVSVESLFFLLRYPINDAGL